MSIDSLIIIMFMTVIGSFAVVAIARWGGGPGHTESRSLKGPGGAGWERGSVLGRKRIGARV
jgi:hypothetical protein